MKQLLIPTNIPNIQIIDNQAKTTTKDVAEFFEKDHKEILRKVQGLDLPRNFTERNFALSEYKDSSGKINPCYELTRDAFIFIVMSFTGKKANLCKIAYINKFNEMEALLSSRPEQLQLDTPVTTDQRKRISTAVYNLARNTHFTGMEIWQMLHAKFGVNSVKELTASQYQPVIDWLTDWAREASRPIEYKPGPGHKALDEEIESLLEKIGERNVLAEIKKDYSVLGNIISIKGHIEQSLRAAVRFDKVMVQLKHMEADYLKIMLVQKMMQ